MLEVDQKAKEWTFLSKNKKNPSKFLEQSVDFSSSESYIKIRICKGRRCSSNFCDDTIKKAQEYLGMPVNINLKNSQVSLETTTCLNYCDFGPNALINDQIIHEMTPQKIEQTLTSLGIPRKQRNKDRNGLESVLDLLQ